MKARNRACGRTFACFCTLASGFLIAGAVAASISGGPPNDHFDVAGPAQPSGENGHNALRRQAERRPFSLQWHPDQFGWQSEFVGPGLEGEVHAMVVFQDDLVVAGDFQAAGQHLSPGVARWDGQQWHGFASDAAEQFGSINGPVYSITEFQGDLIIAGGFTAIGDQDFNRIARWDGSRWQTLDGQSSNGVSGNPPQAVEIRALAVHDGELYVGGRFSSAGGIEVNNLARWSGTDWSLVDGPDGEGVTQTPGTGFPKIRAMTSFAGELIVSGQFDRAGGISVNQVARWNQGTWQDLPNDGGGEGIGAPANTMLVHDGNLLLAGDFFGDNPMVWDGSILTSLAPAPPTGVRPMHINSLALFDGNLVATGRFRPPTTLQSTDFHAARWTGSSWQRLEGPDGEALPDHANVLLSHKGQLIAGGAFLGSGEPRLNRIAAWDGDNWSSLESNGGAGIGFAEFNIHALTLWRGDLIVGGSFRHAGDRLVNHIARWNGREWLPLSGPNGAGIDHDSEFPAVHALAVHDGKLIVGGYFNQAGGLPAYNLARYDGEAWLPLAFADLAQGPVRALTVWEGDLFAAFSTINEWGEEDSVRIARLDDNQWTLLHQPGASGFTLGQVLALMAFDGELLAGGSFTDVDGSGASFLARHDGFQWQPIDVFGDNQPDGLVRSLARWGDDLLIGGGFSQVGTIPATGLARWDGMQWHPPYSNQSTGAIADDIDAMAVVNGALIAIGQFRDAMWTDLGNVARWDGTDWSVLEGPHASGTGFNATAVGQFHGAVLVVGQFDRAGGLPAHGLARFYWEPSEIAITAIETVGLGGWPPNSAFVFAEVGGMVNRPDNGKLTVESDFGEVCVSSSPESVDEQIAYYQCQIEYDGGGPRLLSARFSASSTHADSQSEVVATQARWPTQTAIVQVIPDNTQLAGEPFEVIIAVSGEGTPGGRVLVEAGLDNKCVIELPNDRCTLSVDQPGSIYLYVDYEGDAYNQPSSTSRQYHIVSD